MGSAKVAFVLGGGGVLGAVQVGMLRSLLERAVRPDLIVGTSIGAINGAIIAAGVDLSVARLERAWTSREARALTNGAGIRPGRTHVMSTGPLLRLLKTGLPTARTFADLEVEFRCCAASIERAAEHWFSEGALIPAVLASAALPGVFPAVEIDGEHFLDGGIVNSIPISEAAAAGATEIHVLQVGRIEFPLAAPRHQLDNARVAFEIARRHRFARDSASLPAGVRLHVLPTGVATERENRIARNVTPDAVRRRIDGAYHATCAYLEHEGLAKPAPHGIRS
ncbi:NTE family protein [Agromyces flavus]|uniref:NTE family protein n=1 Tax=Agromyces flavus TaxID=589382 RepID=A0A1H1RJT7_9MICO|nr:patatin-like phospholipase family protein [Agromyces flavus]MCP2368828.1 NTE family protein [Agromyces flavus]GGI48284.1 patatin [Agromyces flavus]SDS35985.1 NTE family protein [Agromyces flavus]